MESFSLLKYWKGNGGGGGGGGSCSSSVASFLDGSTKTLVTAVSDADSDSDSDSDTDSTGPHDDGPFFDLEFAVPADEEERETDITDDEEENDVVKGGACDRSDPNLLPLSPADDDAFFKGRIVRIDGEEEHEETISSNNNNNKSGQFPIPVSLVRSATKLRVFMLGLKRSKSESTTTTTMTTTATKSPSKLFTVNFKVEEVPIFSLLTRASSNSKTSDQEMAAGMAEEKRNKKLEVKMQKYLKLVKPLYVKVSKRNHQETATGAAEELKEEVAAAEKEKEGQKQQGLNLKGIMMAKKHLGKSKSAVVHSMPPNVASKRRDDSLLQQQDGIQSAILHCKRSFNSSREGEEQSQVLSRSVSDPSHEKKKAMVKAAEKDGKNDVVAGQ